jgi:hypothetical protein
MKCPECQAQLPSYFALVVRSTTVAMCPHCGTSLKLAHLVELDQLGKALMLCSRLQMNPRLIGLKAERLGKTAASAVASAPNQLASVAAN